jgi:hypothetical protein
MFIEAVQIVGSVIALHVAQKILTATNDEMKDTSAFLACLYMLTYLLYIFVITGLVCFFFFPEGHAKHADSLMIVAITFYTSCAVLLPAFVCGFLQTGPYTIHPDVRNSVIQFLKKFK